MERFTLGHLSINTIIVLPQIRKSFFGIKYLAQDIYRNGLLQNLVVCILSKEEAKKYVSYISQVHKKYLTLKKYQNQKKYIILIAGERRIRALRLLDTQKKLIELFPNKKIPVSIRTNITAQDALRLQAAENKREDVNKAEEAEFYAQWFFAEKLMHEGKLSINKFSQIAARSPGAISRAIKFHNLPLDLKKMTARGRVSYIVACELSKLQTTPGVLKEEITKLFDLAHTKFDTWQKMRKIIRDFRKNKMEEKNSLFGALDQNESKKYLQAIQNRIETYVTKSVWGAFITSGNLLKKVFESFENGIINYDYSPLLKQGLRKSLRVNLENFHLCVKHLKKTRKKLLKKKEWEATEKISSTAKEILEKTEVYTHE